VAILNTSLLKHPINWIVVTMMLFLAGIGGHFILTYLGMSPATGTGAKK
jgi:hypothetical protein